MEFDPFTAEVTDWQTYLADSKSHLKDFDTAESDDEEFFLCSHLKRFVGEVTKTDLPIERRIKIVESAVSAALTMWEQLADYEIDPRYGGTHPFDALTQLLNIHGEADATLIKTVQRLWHESPRPLDYDDPGYYHLMKGMGAHVPISDTNLEQIYRYHLNQYKMTVIEILLRRGSHERAERLFREKITSFPDIDPLHMQHLVYWGMPIPAMEIWLNQGLNGQDSHAYVRESARARWKEIEAYREQQQTSEAEQRT